MNLSRKISCLGVVAVAAGLLAFPGISRADDASAGLFKTKCAGCHGADGKGETTMGKAMKLRDMASADVQKQSDADLTTIITTGKNKMPAYGKSLSGDQIKGLVGYIRSLKK